MCVQGCVQGCVCVCRGFVAKPMVMASWRLGTGWARQATAKGKSGIEGGEAI